MDCSLQVSSVHRISQARIVEWVAILFWKQLPFDTFWDDTTIYILIMYISASLGH